MPGIRQQGEAVGERPGGQHPGIREGGIPKPEAGMPHSTGIALLQSEALFLLKKHPVAGKQS